MLLCARKVFKNELVRDPTGRYVKGQKKEATKVTDSSKKKQQRQGLVELSD